VEFKPEALPHEGEPIFQKHVNSAFIGTELESTLRRNNVTDLVIVGLTTDHCVSTTTRMAGNLGFNVQVVADATATFERTSYDGKHYSAQDLHESALASLHGEFATIVQTQDLIRT
jgi:nicotinamidase-related amidase